MARAGDRIDIWEVERALGTGGMGSVYRCHNAQAPRILAAVKVLENSLRTSDDAMMRFVREAEILNRLDHPNVVRVRNVRIDHDPPFLEMEFVEGVGLDELIDGRALPLRTAFSYARQLVDALVYVHAQSVRHRDIKPANLLVSDEGTLKLVDFGLAMESDLDRITEAGLAFGTVAYAPPEWIDPAKLDPVQWDLYAAGVVFYEMLLGVPAFFTPQHGSPKQQAMQVMLAKQSAPALDPGEPYPEELRALIRGLTAPKPSDRIRSADEARQRLDRVREIFDKRGWDLSSDPLPSEIATAVPLTRVGLRTGEGAASPTVLPPRVQPPPSAHPSAGPRRWPLRLALGTAILFGIGAGVALARKQPLAAPPKRDVVLEVVGVPADYPVSVWIDGQAPLLREAGGWLFEQVAVGTRQMSWVAGDGCAPEACDDGFPSWCGFGVVPFVVDDAPHVLQVEIPLALPTPSVVVSVPAIQDARVGLFRRKPDYKLTATLDGKLGGIVDEYKAAWRSVIPGKKELVLSVGECPPEALGCWPDRVCPAGCTSTVREIVVPFGGSHVSVPLDLPVPK